MQRCTVSNGTTTCIHDNTLNSGLGPLIFGQINPIPKCTTSNGTTTCTYDKPKPLLGPLQGPPTQTCTTSNGKTTCITRYGGQYEQTPTGTPPVTPPVTLPDTPCPPGQSIVCKPSEPVNSYTYGSLKIVFHGQTSNCGVGMAAVCSPNPLDYRIDK